MCAQPAEKSAPAGGRVIEVLLHDAVLRDKYGPSYATDGAAGLDLRACVKEPLELRPGETRMVSAGLAVHIEDVGLCGMLVPRSGLGAKLGIVLGNLVGIVDSDYTGEIRIALWNRGDETRTVQPYARICQLLFVPVARPQMRFVKAFARRSVRGAGGFGSTGTL